jgi:hypothetical protein
MQMTLASAVLALACLLPAAALSQSADDLTGATLRYQPRATEAEARAIASAILSASEEYGVPALLLWRIGARESAWLPSVGSGERRGARGELGYWQVLPAGAALFECGEGREPTTPSGGASIAACWLAHLLRVCGSPSWAVAVAAYGRGRCPASEAEALSWREVGRVITGGRP